MNRKTLMTTAAGFVLGGVIFNAVPVLAQLATIDVASITQEIKSVAQETGILDVLNAMNTVQNTVSATMKDINTAIGNTTYGDTNTLLREGFTQNSNYQKAQVGAQQQIADASNTAMALAAAVMFVAGVQILCLGLASEMLCRTYYESQQKPIYAIKSREARQRIRTRPAVAQPLPAHFQDEHSAVEAPAAS